MRVNEILETCLYVDDLEAAERFYGDVLGLEFVSRKQGRHVFWRCGQRMLLLFNPREVREFGSDTPHHGAQGMGHVAFAVPDDQIEAWADHLAERGVAIERRVEWPQGGRSLYFRDPAGNSLELASPKIWGLDERQTLP
jgi:catechol 2,3-dioxygenase-like lactoylglutathione lyase family enzyme